MVPEGREAFGSLTVEENLLVGTGIHARDRGWRPRVATEMEAVYATFPILKNRRNGQAGLLSGGQQQMLAIGRTLMTNPRLIAIDEPSLGLAPNITDQVYERLIALQTERRLTLLMVEQSSARAVMVGGRMILMRGGEIVLDGDARTPGNQHKSRWRSSMPTPPAHTTIDHRASSSFRPVRAFAQEIVGQLVVFIRAHESGNIRNGHRCAVNFRCESFRRAPGAPDGSSHLKVRQPHEGAIDDNR